VKAARGEVVRAGLVGVLLLVLGLSAWGASRVYAGVESSAFAPSALPPVSVALTAGRQYTLGYPGGVRGLAARGMTPADLACDWQRPAGSPRELSVQTVPTDTVLTSTVGTFVAPVGGELMITCGELGSMFIDDADDAGADVAGWLLVLASAALAVGGVLCLRQLRGGRPVRTASAGAAGEDEQVERLVRVVHLRALDDEVVGADGLDVAP
jgi:hypothetical protein